jgi:hypothetical protein
VTHPATLAAPTTTTTTTHTQTHRATAMDEGKIHPVDAWNFTAGDVWCV